MPSVLKQNLSVEYLQLNPPRQSKKFSFLYWTDPNSKVFALEFSNKREKTTQEYCKETREYSPNSLLGISLRLSVAERGLTGGSTVNGGEHSPPLTGDGPKEPFWLRGPKDDSVVLTF